MNQSARRINLLAAGLRAQKYLEVGVDKGLTFADVKIKERTAVDPQFKFDPTPFVNENTEFHEQTSDHFFSEIEIETIFDLLFIDGLHQFEQVVRDFSNAIIHSHPRSVIILDDTKPNDIYSASPLPEETLKFRRLTGSQDTSWHGDVYKVVFYIHDFWPALNYRTIVGSGNPQTLVWRSKNFNRKPLLNNLESISRISYYQLMKNIIVLRECDEGIAIAEVLEELTGINPIELASGVKS